MMPAAILASWQGPGDRAGNERPKQDAKRDPACATYTNDALLLFGGAVVLEDSLDLPDLLVEAGASFPDGLTVSAPDIQTGALDLLNKPSGRLIAYGYDDLSRRSSITRPNGTSSAYTYKDNGALDTFNHTLTGGGSVGYGFGYNRVLQITGRSTDNDLYAWTNHYNVDRGSSYGYDGENRLAAVALPNGTVTTAYDPSGRLRQTSASAATQFLYDGTALIAEYNATGGALIGRYVPGASIDETIAGYDAGGTKSWYHTDAQGSVVATSDGSGNAVVINQYGPNGEPGLVYQGRNQGRIRFTGQAMIFEAGTTGIPQILYDYKARIYAPKLGRFLQTDPIGAADDRNLYAYVGNDPINQTAPSGLFADMVKGKPQKAIQKQIDNCKDPAIAAALKDPAVKAALADARGQAAATGNEYGFEYGRSIFGGKGVTSVYSGSSGQMEVQSHFSSLMSGVWYREIQFHIHPNPTGPGLSGGPFSDMSLVRSGWDVVAMTEAGQTYCGVGQ